MKKTAFNAPYYPYKDYFNETDNVHQLLFKPGDNVTNAELNEIQSIIQDQIALFGSYFLTPDSVVTGGVYKIDRCPSLFYTSNFILEEQMLLKCSTSETIVKVLVIETDTSKEACFLCMPIAGSLKDEDLVFNLYNEETLSVDTTKEVNINILSYGSFIHFSESILFIEGYFVFAPEQKCIISADSKVDSASIGFDISKSIIIPEENASLIDNAETESFGSPGADRYQILAKLKVIPSIENDDMFDVSTKGSFLEYLRLKNGKVIKDVRLPIHSEFEKTLARRTFDTSGSYTVRPFRIKIEEYSPTDFIIRISPGKAYIFGFEIDILRETEVLLPRLVNQTYYRYDKLVIDSKGNFILLKGAESPTPVIPKDQPNALTLYKFLFKPGCDSTTLIGIRYVNNRRYTMRDIGKLEQRIENLEYYTSLSLLEKQTADQNITDQNGNKRFKNGFLVDNFKTYNTVDLYAKDNKFSMDLEKGELRPTFEMGNLGLQYNPTKSSNVKRSEDIITLPFTETSLIIQPKASGVVNVNPYEVFIWEGKIKLTPQNVFWVDTNTKPDVTVNHQGKEDVWDVLGEKGFNLEWGIWDTKILNSSTPEELNQLSKSSNSNTQQLWNPLLDDTVGKTLIDKYNVWIATAYVSGFARKPDGYIKGKPAVFLPLAKNPSSKKIVSKTETRSIGESVKAVALAPFINAQVIKFEGFGFKPSSKLFAFFGEKEATNWCTTDEVSYGVLSTNNKGYITGFLHLPGKTFTIGSYNFKLTDDRTPTAQLTTTFGIAKFYARGMTQTKQETFISTREPELLSTSIDSDIVIS